MKLFAQVGNALGEKVNKALSEGIIEGAIFSPKDLQKSTLCLRIQDIRKNYPDAELLIDPQFYLSLFASSPAINIGKVDEWDSFKIYRKSDLEIQENLDMILQQYFKEMSDMNITGIIAPGVYISRSFDSREAVIAKNFIRRARSNYTGDKPLYVSLVVCREALLNQQEFDEFINDISLLSDPPDGFYIIVGSRSSDARSDIFHSNVISNWMMVNLSLSTNGFKVINGYSDILTPFLGASGGYAGATGWWSNLRMFSMDRFYPSRGGNLPIIRYLSKKLLNRITISEKDAMSLFVPEIVNRLPHDDNYDPEPERNMEVLQSWEALKSLIDETGSSLDGCTEAIRDAQIAYAAWGESGLPLDTKSNDSHLEPLSEGVKLFKSRAQL